MRIFMTICPSNVLETLKMRVTTNAVTLMIGISTNAIKMREMTNIFFFFFSSVFVYFLLCLKYFLL